MTSINMERRINRLEEQAPANAHAVRVVFRDSAGRRPAIEPPLRQNEQLIVVNFVRSEKARA